MAATKKRWAGLVLNSNEPANTGYVQQLLYLANGGAMGGGISRRDPEVHVVVVQSQENGKMDAKVLRQTYTSLNKGMYVLIVRVEG